MNFKPNFRVRWLERERNIFRIAVSLISSWKLLPSFLCLVGLKYWSSVFWCTVRGSVVGSIPVGKCPSLKNFFKLSWIFSHKYLRVLYLCMLHLQLLPPFHLFRCFGFEIFFATYPFEMNLRGFEFKVWKKKIPYS